MTGPLWLLRMARWVRHPPSPGRVKLLAVVAGICALIWGIEYAGYWPDWMATNGRVRVPRP